VSVRWNRRPRWVFFDAGGTLLGTCTKHRDWYERFFIEALAELGIDAPSHEVGRALHLAARTCRVRRRSASSRAVVAHWSHVYSKVFAEFVPQHQAHSLAQEHISRFERGESVELFHDALPLLQHLRSAGVRMAIVSNFGTYLDDFLSQLNIRHFFDAVLISAAEGVEKPEREFYYRALAAAKTSPRDVLFIGDSPHEDVEMPQALGMEGLLLDRHDIHSSRTGMRRVHSLLELTRAF
jgi:HAD superfamily hydrolase (TIGR01549 family)